MQLPFFERSKAAYSGLQRRTYEFGTAGGLEQGKGQNSGDYKGYLYFPCIIWRLQAAEACAAQV
jgi:hypothetical protein